MAEQNTPNLNNITVPTPDGGWGGAQSLYDIMAPDYLNKPVAQFYRSVTTPGKKAGYFRIL